MNYAVILAGGSGERAGGGTPKQFREVLGKPVIAYTLQIFEDHPEIDGIMVGCHVKYYDYLQQIIQKYNITKVKWIVDGGNTFSETVMSCVNGLDGKINDDDLAVVHYSACPFTKPEIVSDCIRLAKEKKMAFAGTPYRDRLNYIQVASPQTYHYGYLKHIYEEGKRQDLLDKVDPHTTSLMSALGYPMYASYSDQSNLKITTEEDFELFEGWVMVRKKYNKLPGSHREV